MTNQQPIIFQTQNEAGSIIIKANIPCQKCGSPNIKINPPVFVYKNRHYDAAEPGCMQCSNCQTISALPADVALELAKFIAFHSGNVYPHCIVVAATQLLWITGTYFEINRRPKSF